jgi:homoserine O-acetyltransferase
MRARPLVVLAAALTAAVTAGPAAAQARLAPPQVATLGACALEGGGTIRDCRIAYRTLGALDAGKRNAVLAPTWLAGDSDAYLAWLRLPELVDTTRFFVVVAEAFGSGRSSSPSNSPTQPGAGFPPFGLPDVVAAHRRLLREVLGVPRLHAVIGYSMGGMQALEWGVAYPDDVERLVGIAPQARLTTYNRVMVDALLRAIALGRRHGAPDDSVAALVGAVLALMATTPDKVNERPPNASPAIAAEMAGLITTGRSLADVASQLRAIRAYDVATRFGGDLARAARAARARALVFYSPGDLITQPATIAEYARLLGAETVVVPSRCGHSFPDPACEHRAVAAAVRRFLATPAERRRARGEPRSVRP